MRRAHRQRGSVACTILLAEAACTLAGDAIAWGAYTDAALTPSNFGQLHVFTSEQAPDELQMRAAGFLEGWLSAGAHAAAALHAGAAQCPAHSR